MPDNLLIFLGGLVVVLVPARIFRVLPRLLLIDLILFWGVGAMVMTLVAWLVLGALEQQYSFGFYRFTYWLARDQGSALLGGIAAGCIVAAALSAITRLGQDANYATISILTAGPAASIAALYFIATPAARQSLGLTGVKVSAVELTFATPVPNSWAVPSYTPISGNALGPRYSPWFKNFWYMFLDLDEHLLISQQYRLQMVLGRRI
jgi:hypothetical protein